MNLAERRKHGHGVRKNTLDSRGYVRIVVERWDNKLGGRVTGNIIRTIGLSDCTVAEVYGLLARKLFPDG